jgi:hypothetical protein
MSKGALKKGLAKAGIFVHRVHGGYEQDGLATIHNDNFRRLPSFKAAYRRGVEATNGCDPSFEWRVHVALWAAQASLRTPGDFVECGVNGGFMSSAIMHRLRWNEVHRKFFLVDTWNGPPMNQYDEVEIRRGSRHLAEDAIARKGYLMDLERVRANFAEWQGAVIVQGLVPEVLPTIATTQVAFLHLDMNCAYPERAALEFFWECLSPGAIVLLDDYAYSGYEQQGIAIDSLANRLGVEVLSLPTGQGLIIK